MAVDAAPPPPPSPHTGPSQRPPAKATDPLVALADRCVQCGLCLPTCPTYLHERNEAESPRGRIALARAWALDIIPATPAGDAHWDHCLACRSCEAVCPAGVQYGELLKINRTRQRARRAPGWRQRWLEWLTAHPRWLAASLGGYRRIFGLLPHAWRLLPRPPSPAANPRTVEFVALPVLSASPRVDAGNDAPVSAALFVGCVARAYEPAVRTALAELCAAAGVDLLEPRAQGCCGSLHAHAGNDTTARQLAQAQRAAFAGASTVLTLASGCHEAVAQALPAPTRTVDALTWLAEHADALRFRPCAETVALHLPCTQRNVSRSVPALRRLLARVPGLRVIELDAGFGCCGAAGSQMLTDPARAASYREPLVAQLHATSATRLLSANVGCRLHFASATALPVQHPLQLLAELLDPEPSA